MASLADTNLLVYAYDPRDGRKQHIARQVLQEGFRDDSVRIAHQAVVEFFSVVTRPTPNSPPILDLDTARRETEDLLAHVEVLYPNLDVLRTALHGREQYQLAWYDAHMWAYAEVFGLTTIISEDFQHDRMYGRVRAVNPFR